MTAAARVEQRLDGIRTALDEQAVTLAGMETSLWAMQSDVDASRTRQEAHEEERRPPQHSDPQEEEEEGQQQQAPQQTEFVIAEKHADVDHLQIKLAKSVAADMMVSRKRGEPRPWRTVRVQQVGAGPALKAVFTDKCATDP